MPLSKKAYVLTLDGKAVEDDGKQSGVVLVGAGGLVSGETAKKYGLSVDDGPEPGTPTALALGTLGDGPPTDSAGAEATVAALNEAAGYTGGGDSDKPVKTGK